MANLYSEGSGRLYNNAEQTIKLMMGSDFGCLVSKNNLDD